MIESPPLTAADIAIGRGWHAIKADGVRKDLMAMIAVRPVVQFDGLEPGKTYVSNPGRDNCIAVEILNRSPSGRKVAWHYLRTDGTGQKAEEFSGSWRGRDFHEMDADLIAVRLYRHRQAVEEGQRRGLEIPPEVRREHPGLFLDVPDRFAQTAPYPETAEHRVAHSLSPSWGRYPGVAEFEERIDTATRHLTRFIECYMERIATKRTAAAQSDYDKAEAEFHDVIDYWRWLIPHVAESGIFYAENSQEES